MDKIIFKISRNSLYISILTKETADENLNNTNIIDTKELIFSKDYILMNLDLVSSFLNVVIIKRNVKKVIINDYNIISVVLKIINEIPNIEELYLRPNEKINYKIFMELLNNKYLKVLDVYDIPVYLLERLDINKNLIVKTRTEIFFISKFMEDNKLSTYSDNYYKKNIYINHTFTKEDLYDFETFLSINHHLKTITICNYSVDTFNNVLNLILELNKKDIKVIIFEEKNDLKEIYSNVNILKSINDKVIKENNISFKIHYSIEFKRKNLFKQLNLNFIKISLLSFIFVTILLMGLNYYKNYAQAKDINSIENELKEIINQIDKEYDFDDQDSDIEYIDIDTGLTVPTTTRSTYVSSYYKNYEKVFDTLLNINNETKGWLTVNNTRIDYPIVQASNNEYYLDRDFNKQKNSMGWVYMDYRNSIDVLDQNTIIYGHNITAGIMFGTLRYTLNQNWYNKTANQTITFNTLNRAMQWQIISVYKIPNTIDYLSTKFYNRKEYQEFLDLIVGRSIHNFNQKVTYTDKILTLSTCQNRGEDRLVIHAKLITE